MIQYKSAEVVYSVRDLIPFATTDLQAKWPAPVGYHWIATVYFDDLKFRLESDEALNAPPPVVEAGPAVPKELAVPEVANG